MRDRLAMRIAEVKIAQFNLDCTPEQYIKECIRRTKKRGKR
jgi:hypothetical protein